jgi:hypothetical protein
MAVPKFILFFPDTLSISHFTETDIINFLINYKDMCKNYNIKKRERIRHCPRYYTKHIAIIVKRLVSFLEPN